MNLIFKCTLISAMTLIALQIPANGLMAQEINEQNLNQLFNFAEHCLSIAGTPELLLKQFDCCNAMEQTWVFVTTLDLTGFSSQLQAHAGNLYHQILPMTGGPFGVGQLGPIVNGVAQGCLPPCDRLTDPNCERAPELG